MSKRDQDTFTVYEYRQEGSESLYFMNSGIKANGLHVMGDDAAMRLAIAAHSLGTNKNKEIDSSRFGHYGQIREYITDRETRVLLCLAVFAPNQQPPRSEQMRVYCASSVINGYFPERTSRYLVTGTETISVVGYWGATGTIWAPTVSNIQCVSGLEALLFTATRLPS